MSLITKAIAQEVALRLTAKKLNEVEALRLNLRNVFTEMYLATIPEEILKLFKAHPSYFEARSSFQLQGNGCNYEYLSTNKNLPFSKRLFMPTAEQAGILLPLCNSLDAKNKELKELRNEIEITLNSLRSYKRIRELFPEAAPFLPEKITTALAVNISDLQSRLE